MYVHTPILTGSDCEGAGEMFTVTSLNLKDNSHFSGGREFDFSKEELAGAIERCGISPTVRGEKLGLSEFAALANELVKVASESN